MRFSLAFAGLVAAAAAQSYDLTGAYWDVSVTTQTGRPGYEIKDVTVDFHNPLAAENKAGKCHYSFVPNNGRPSITDTCDEGLAYTWDYTTLTLTHKVPIGNETVTMYGSVALTSSCSGSGSGGGRVCKSSGKVDLSHYCRLDVPSGPLGTGVYGCYAVDGSA